MIDLTDWPYDRWCPANCPPPARGFEEGFTHCPYCGSELVEPPKPAAEDDEPQNQLDKP